jgi:superfamily II DNA helicase RecQ
MAASTLSLEQVLHEEFGHKAFRPNQRAVVDAILAGRDCLTLMATGGGKSLTYQIISVFLRRLAALAQPDAPPRGCSIIVSPLIALIENQVDALPRGVRGIGLTSASNDAAARRAVEAGEYHLVYVTPERIAGPWQATLRDMAARGLIHMVAVDEAHTVSQWGLSFRPDYRRLAVLRSLLPDTVPILALTATATERTRDDVVATLRLRQPVVVSASCTAATPTAARRWPPRFGRSARAAP